MEHKNFVIVGGFNSSGSSAVVDLLKEFKGFYECNAEFRIICDPYGIKQMERALIDDWDWINSSAAIKNFLLFCKKSCRKKTYFPLAPYGQGYKYTINKKFMEITEDYIKKIVEYNYKQDFFWDKSQKTYFRYVSDRIRYAIEYLTNGKVKVANRNIIQYFSHPTKEEFYCATQEYFESLFSDVNQDNKVDHIILDQAIAPNYAQDIHHYFKKAKMIIVDRDPRDIFSDCLIHSVDLDDNSTTEEYGHQYVVRQRALRERIPVYDKDILRINFEDLILKYDFTLNKIIDFLNISSKEHIYPKKYLIPEISKKNIGTWRKYYDKFKKVIDIIESELTDLLYEPN